MPTRPEALRLADAIDPFVRPYAPDHLTSKVAAAELRRLSAVEAQRDALLEKIKAVIAAEQSEGAGRGGFVNTPPTREHQRRVAQAWQELHAAIKTVEGENT